MEIVIARRHLMICRRRINEVRTPHMFTHASRSGYDMDKAHALSAIGLVTNRKRNFRPFCYCSTHNFNRSNMQYVMSHVMLHLSDHFAWPSSSRFKKRIRSVGSKRKGKGHSQISVTPKMSLTTHKYPSLPCL